ncbi:MAG: phosphatase PAP2 family protein [Fibrobacterota bacterium]|nr:phosphatase PAP2 family protein [Fibrobacterota bacterium]
MERLGHRGRAWLVFAGLTSLVVLFIMLTAHVRDFHATDEKLLLLMREPGDPKNAIGTPRFEEFMRDISALGSQGVLFLGVFAASGMLVLRRQYHAAILLIVAAVGAYFVAAGLKGIFDRPRPSLVTHLSFHTGTRSFPSGHSVMAAAVYLTLGALLSRLVKPMGQKIYFISMAALLAFIIGASRIYLGMHHPTDVVAGWIIGVYWAGLCWEVMTVMQRRGKVEPPR